MGTEVVKVVFNEICKLCRLQSWADCVLHWCSDVLFPSVVFWRTRTCQAEYFVGSWWAYLVDDTARLPIWVTPSGGTIFETSNQNSVCLGGGGGVFRRRSKRMDVKLTTHLSLVPRLWRLGGIPPPFQRSRRVACLSAGTTLHLCQLVKEYRTFCETRRFIYPASGPEAEPHIHKSTSHPHTVSLWFVLLFFAHLRRALHEGSLPPRC